MIQKKQNMLGQNKFKIKIKLSYTVLIIIVLLVSCRSINNIKLKNATKKILTGFTENYLSQKSENDDRFLCVEFGKSDTSFIKESYYQFEVLCKRKQTSSSYKYDKLYQFNDFPVLFYDTVGENIRIKNLFKEIPYQNLNFAKSPGVYDGAPNWVIFFNRKLEIVQVFPQKDTMLIRTILEAKGLKFAVNYNKQ